MLNNKYKVTDIKSLKNNFKKAINCLKIIHNNIGIKFSLQDIMCYKYLLFEIRVFKKQNGYSTGKITGKVALLYCRFRLYIVID